MTLTKVALVALGVFAASNAYATVSHKHHRALAHANTPRATEYRAISPEFDNPGVSAPNPINPGGSYGAMLNGRNPAAGSNL